METRGYAKTNVKESCDSDVNYIAYEYKHNLLNCWKVLLDDYTTVAGKPRYQGLKSS